MEKWTEVDLDKLPVRGHFRLRGLEMTRLETFCDAAFAFAVTLLVISGDGMPTSYEDLLKALRGVPAFAASFAAIGGIWVAHRAWSRRYGLEDAVTTMISLALVFVVLIYVYPLKMVFAAFFYWITGGWVPTDFTLTSNAQLLGIFRIYGIGFAALYGLMALLTFRALRAPSLNLNRMERLLGRQDVVIYLILAVTGLISTIWASVFPYKVSVYAGFMYATLCVTMPVTAILQTRKATKMSEVPNA